MTDCPYLINKPTGCVNCLPWKCTAGREKKLSDVSVCRDEVLWPECPKYLSLQPNAAELIMSTPVDTSGLIDVKFPQLLQPNAAELIVSTPITSEWTGFIPVTTISLTPQTCPYLEYPPNNQCCSATCYAKGVRVAPRKNCRSPGQCTRYLAAKLAELPFRGK